MRWLRSAVRCSARYAASAVIRETSRSSSRGAGRRSRGRRRTAARRRASSAAGGPRRRRCRARPAPGSRTTRPGPPRRRGSAVAGAREGVREVEALVELDPLDPPLRVGQPAVDPVRPAAEVQGHAAVAEPAGPRGHGHGRGRGRARRRRRTDGRSAVDGRRPRLTGASRLATAKQPGHPAGEHVAVEALGDGLPPGRCEPVPQRHVRVPAGAARTRARPGPPAARATRSPRPGPAPGSRTPRWRRPAARPPSPRP